MEIIDFIEYQKKLELKLQIVIYEDRTFVVLRILLMSKKDKKICFDDLVYLDTEFVISKYEELKNVSPDTQFTKLSSWKM